jgi:hypothetical protein
MTTVSIILSAITILLVLSQLVCGLWLRAKGGKPEDVTFHARLGIGSALTALVTVVVMLTVVVQH